VSDDGRGGDRASLEADSLAGPRLAKVDAIRDTGGEAYPYRFRPDVTAAELHERFGDLEPETSTRERGVVAGRLVGFRDIGKLIFAVLQDGSGRIQLYAEAGRLGDRHGEFADLDVGDWVGAGGEIITTRKGELSVAVDDFTLLAKALRPLPEKFHGLQDVEARHRQRYLDLIANEEARESLRIRSKAVAALRNAFVERGFVEVEGPVLQVEPGGALARPFVTHHNALGIDLYLRIALELHLKRLIVGGVERVFEIGRIFRNEGVSPRHNPEFTMLEAYQAYADYTDIMELVEETIAETAQAATGSTKVMFEGREIDFAPPWERRPFLELVGEHSGTEFSLDMDLDELRARAGALGIEVDSGWDAGKIVEEVFDKATEAKIWGPTHVHDYPTSISPFARPLRDGAPELVERFESIVAGRELLNAFTEINDPLEQRRRFEAQAALRAAGDDEAHSIDDEFLRALEYGMPPTGGLGIGVDRLVMLLAGQSSIREVILFPTLKPE
jgi:lysyl-tRNA synthetase